MQRSFFVNKEELKEEVKSKHGGRPLTEEELKEHLNAFKGFEDSIDNLLKKEKKGK